MVDFVVGGDSVVGLGVVGDSVVGFVVDCCSVVGFVVDCCSVVGFVVGDASVVGVEGFIVEMACVVRLEFISHRFTPENGNSHPHIGLFIPFPSSSASGHVPPF